MALITVLLILAVATVLAVSAAVSQQLSVRKTQNMLNMQQAWEYVLGLELWAQAVLDQDARQNTIDTPQDVWNAGIAQTSVSNGSIQAAITDLQSRFNINNLIRNGEVSEIDQQRFQRLLVYLDINVDISNAVLDWMDGDSQTRYPGGAEDDLYMNRQPPYRAANRRFADKSELLLVEGIDAATYQRLAPYIVALPGYVAININTASEVTLKILADELTLSDAQSLILARQLVPVDDLDEWLKQSLFEASDVSKQGLSLSSDYFQVEGSVEISRRRIRHVSTIYRPKAQQSRVLQRHRQGLFDG